MSLIRVTVFFVGGDKPFKRLDESVDASPKDREEDAPPSEEGLAKRIRLLKRKALRAGVWLTALRDTERGILGAALHLREMGRRIRAVVDQIERKLAEHVRSAYFSRLEELGKPLALATSKFFYGEGGDGEAAGDVWLHRYLGLRLASLGFLTSAWRGG